MRFRNAVFAMVGLAVGLLAASRIPMHAQQPPREAPPPAPVGTAGEQSAAGRPSLQDALLKPYAFDFERPTTLEEVARRLSADLGAEVVLDAAALQRLDVRKDDAVELGLKSARLKTGLKLLLDQVDMTYRLVPEDNLLIITDKEGSEDPLDGIWAELVGLHRDLHAVQDALDDLLDLQGYDDGLQFRQPTIIQEMPGMQGPDVVPDDDQPPTDDDEQPTPPRRPRT